MKRYESIIRWMGLVLIIVLVAVAPFSHNKADAASEITSCRVYKNYTSSNAGDWLIVLTYNTDIEDCDMGAHLWWIELINNGTGAILNQVPIRSCGMKPGCMYLSPAQASLYDWQGNYSIKIEGHFNYPTPPNYTWDLQPTDWQSSTTWLPTWVIDQAKAIGQHDNGSDWLYVDPSSSAQEKLNMYGAPMFSTGIDNLINTFPDLFAIALTHVVPDWTAPGGNHSYETDLASKWEISMGPEISGLWNDVGDYFNLSGRVIGIILIGVGFLCLATYTKTIAFGILLGGVIIGVYPFAIIIITCALLFFVFVRAFFLSST